MDAALGTGIFTERALRERAAITPFAGVSLFALDAQTMEVLAKGERVAEGPIYNLNPLISSRPLGGPAPFFAGFNLPLNDEQKQFLRPVLQSLVSSTVRTLVEQTGL